MVLPCVDDDPTPPAPLCACGTCARRSVLEAEAARSNCRVVTIFTPSAPEESRHTVIVSAANMSTSVTGADPHDAFEEALRVLGLEVPA